jgi:hypothetical protein
MKHEVFHYPKWYFCRKGVSDLNEILTLMQNIPLNQQRDVSEAYENLYLRSGRYEAQNWLREVCK